MIKYVHPISSYKMEEHKNPTSENREYFLIVEYVSRFDISFYNFFVT
jgi:hypothetical protein